VVVVLVVLILGLMVVGVLLIFVVIGKHVRWGRVVVKLLVGVVNLKILLAVLVVMFTGMIAVVVEVVKNKSVMVE